MKIDGGPIENGLPPIHPGEYLADDLDAMEMTEEDFDRALGIPPGTTAGLVKGHGSITPELALRLSHYFGTTARVWTDLQSTYDLKMVKQKIGREIEKQVTPRRRDPQGATD